MNEGAGDITRVLNAWTNGDPTALDRLTPLVYEQLLRIARHHVRRERGGVGPQTVSLVHEAYLRLTKAEHLDWRHRAHFFAVASRMMRRILVDTARRRGAAKRGGLAEHMASEGPLDFDELPAHIATRREELCAVDDALTRLAELEPRKAQVVELRFFGGLTVEETAEALDISPQSVLRDWKLARAWLTRDLTRPPVESRG